MVTIRNAKEIVKNLVADLRNAGYSPTRAVVFGSVAKGTANQWSDLDVAIWDSRFIGCTPLDYEPILHILRNYSRLELHTFPKDENAQNNPFISELEKKGIEVEVQA